MRRLAATPRRNRHRPEQGCRGRSSQRQRASMQVAGFGSSDSDPIKNPDSCQSRVLCPPGTTCLCLSGVGVLTCSRLQKVSGIHYRAGTYKFTIDKVLDLLYDCVCYLERSSLIPPAHASLQNQQPVLLLCVASALSAPAPTLSGRLFTLRTA